MKPGIFLDRDGTVIKLVEDLQLASQLKLLPHVARAIRAFHRMGFLVFIVTNQPVVARGWLKENELQEIHHELLRRLRKEGAYINAVYYCPHHLKADMKKYRKACACRKPGIGMVRQITREFHVDTKKSLMIGDMTQDILAGKRAGMKTILVGTGHGGRDKKFAVAADYRVRDLYRAALLIERLRRRGGGLFHDQNERLTSRTFI